MADSKIKKATALKYDGADSAPVVVASGQGEIAERIVKLAHEAGLHISNDPVLAELLAKVPVGQEIPEELYLAVAEILTYVYRLNGQHK
ncbi:MAG: EscU/YscU/HrcU family type III secretion system export apparatus switch protein [Desulfuromonadaceae bacterium]|nr:EscU/YscU/HrcU family type III secretion system export apparatus switch protein [Desulfuromonadaceae bacterium]